MKVLIDARLYGLEHAGLGRYTQSLITQLAKLDGNVHYQILLRKKYFQSLKLPENWVKILADFRHYSVTEQLKLPKLISRANPDIVHYTHFNVSMLSKYPFVVTIHDMLMHKFKGGEATTLPVPFYQVRRVGYNLAFNRAVRSSKKVIVPSIAVKQEVVKHYSLSPDKVVVTYEGLSNLVGESTTKLSAKQVLTKHALTRPYFIYVGNAYPHKNLDRAVEAIVHLNNNLKQKALFAIAGSRDIFKERLDKTVSRLDGKDYIRFLGFVGDEELFVLMNNSVAFFYPSLSEGFGLQGLEAMSANTVLLASDIAVFKEIFKDNAIYLNPFDFSAMARVLSDALDMDNEKREKMVKKALKFIRRYSWSKMAKETLDVYNQVVAQQ